MTMEFNEACKLMAKTNDFPFHLHFFAFSRILQMRRSTAESLFISNYKTCMYAGIKILSTSADFNAEIIYRTCSANLYLFKSLSSLAIKYANLKIPKKRYLSKDKNPHNTHSHIPTQNIIFCTKVK